MIRFKGHRRTCWDDCGGLLAIVSFERNEVTLHGIQGKLRCLTCGATSIVYGVNCERAPGAQIEEPPFPVWRESGSTSTSSRMRVEWCCQECGLLAWGDYGEALDGWLVTDNGAVVFQLCPDHNPERANVEVEEPVAVETHYHSAIVAVDGDEVEKLAAMDVEVETFESVDAFMSAIAGHVGQGAVVEAPARTSATPNEVTVIPVYQKPLLSRWVGSKARSLSRIVPLIPKKFGDYFEPFLGGGALAFALLRLRREGAVSFDKAILSDVNERLIRCYRGVRDNVDGVIAGLRETKALYDADPEGTYENARTMSWVYAENVGEASERAAMFDVDKRDDVTVAVWFLFMHATCFNGVYRVNAKNEYNVPLGRQGATKTRAKGKPLPFKIDEDRIRECAELLQGVTLNVMSWDAGTGAHDEEWNEVPLSWIGDSARGDVVYIDPPYAALSETANFGEKAGGYSGDGFDGANQAELALCCGIQARIGVTVIASNADKPAVRALYEEQGFAIETIKVGRSVSSKATKREAVNELLMYANTETFAASPTPQEPTAMPKSEPKTRKPRSKKTTTDTPMPYIVTVQSNVKSDTWAPWTVDFDGPKVLVVGANASGKSRVLNAIELAISGRATDVNLRDPKAPNELLALAPPGAGMLIAEVEWSDGSKDSWGMPVTIVDGERKAGKPLVANTVAAVLPIRDLEDSITGSADKARMFFLARATENVTVTDADVLSLLPTLFHSTWTATAYDREDGTAGKLLAMIDRLRESVRELKNEKKMHEALVQQLGERMMAGMPTEAQEAELAAQVTAAETSIAQIANLGRFERIVTARHALAAHREQLATLPPFDSRVGQNDKVLAELSHLLALSMANGAENCPLCEHPTSWAEFQAAHARILQTVATLAERDAAGKSNNQRRTDLDAAIASLQPRAMESEDISSGIMPASLLELDAQQLSAKLGELQTAKHVAESQLAESRLLRSRWQDVVKARDRIVECSTDIDYWGRMERSLCEVRDALVHRGVSSFAEHVGKFLLEGDRFGLVTTDSSGREVFQLGLWRGDDSPVFHAALSGAEWTRVLCAVGAVLSEGMPAVILPRERAIDVDTLGGILKALQPAPGSIVLTSVVAPGTRATKGWCVVDVGGAVTVSETRTSARDVVEGAQEMTAQALPPQSFGSLGSLGPIAKGEA